MRLPTISNAQAQRLPSIDAAPEARVTHMVSLSLPEVQFNTATPHHAVDKHLRQRKAPHTFLRLSFLVQNLSTTYTDDVRDRGEIFVPAARSRTAFVDTDEIAEVAAHVLTEVGHLGKAYTLSGEQSLDYYSVAAQLSAELGFPVLYARPSVDTIGNRFI